jgi:ABC-type methionine transport system ATPase subunit
LTPASKETRRVKLEVRDVSLSRVRTVGERAERARVLTSVSFAVGEGEAFGIIGPSGSGKTSLLRLLNGLDSPDSGRVLLDGRDTAEMEALVLRRRIGMVFQAPSLFPGTVQENVEYALALMGAARDGRGARGRRCLDRAGLPASFWSREASELSRGEQQRVSIARALAAEPEVLLMDEPTSALDPTAAERILCLAQSLNVDDGVTVVFVTHLMDQARRVCGRALVLVDGQGVEEGQVERLFVEPSHELTRRFIEGRLDSCGAEPSSAGGGAATGRPGNGEDRRRTDEGRACDGSGPQGTKR